MLFGNFIEIHFNYLKNVHETKVCLNGPTKQIILDIDVDLTAEISYQNWKGKA